MKTAHTSAQPSNPFIRQSFPREFYLALFGLLFFAMGVQIMVPLLPLYITEELGRSETWLGTATLLLTMAAVALRIPGGTLSDRLGRRAVLLAGAVMGVVSGVLYILSTEITLFLVARMLTGGAIALFTTASKALAVDLAPARRRGEAIGLNNAAFSFAGIASPLISEAVRNAWGFDAAFLLLTILITLALALTVPLSHDRPDQTGSRGARRDLGDIFRQRGIWAALMILQTSGIVMSIIFTFFPLMAKRRELFTDAPELLSPVAMGLGLSLWSLTDTLVEPVAGRLSDRFGRQIVAAPGLAVLMAGLFMLSQASSTWGAYLAIITLTAGWGAFRSVGDAVSQDAVPPVLRGMSAAVIYMGFDLIVGVSAQVLSTLINGADFSMFFNVSLAAVLISGLLGIGLSRGLTAHEQRYEAREAAHPAPSQR